MIERIVINNYKSIREADISLRGINVMIGMNGAGKSNLISFFDFFRALYDQRLNQYVLQHGGMDRLLYNGRKYSDCIEAIIDFSDRYAIQFNLIPTVDDKVMITYLKDYFNSVHDSSKHYERWNCNLWDENVMESSLTMDDSYRAGYLRAFIDNCIVYHFHDTSMDSRMRAICDVDDNIRLRADASNLAACLYLMSEKEPTNFKILEGTIRSIAPYFKRFRLMPSRLNEAKIKIEWEEMSSDVYRDAYSFSDGTIRFIALATLLLQKDKPRVIIIDEPELGLHPAAIEKLASLIRMAAVDSQIIVATQSTGLVNCFEAEDVLVADKINGETVYERYSEDDLRVWLDDYNMGDIWEKNLIGGRP